MSYYDYSRTELMDVLTNPSHLGFTGVKCQCGETANIPVGLVQWECDKCTRWGPCPLTRQKPYDNPDQGCSLGMLQSVQAEIDELVESNE